MKDLWPILVAVIVLLTSAGVIWVAKKNGGQLPLPSPSPEPVAAVQLSSDKYPIVSLDFSTDGNYVTVNVENINAEQIEYNLIYEATVKGNVIQTGVNASQNLKGKKTYTQKQLLGSESSGKFTYHTKIKNAVMELTLREAKGGSVYSASYPFEVTPGKSSELKAN
ncbi:hypothetical protein HZB69_01560 [Candidatus Amesbacteria bacterium]|nr:hypothetical protein [Candidatus Amesbacteria bacterium]